MADHYDWAGDAISSLKVYEKMTDNAEIRKYVNQDILHLHITINIHNMLNNRINMAKQNLMILFLC